MDPDQLCGDLVAELAAVGTAAERRQAQPDRHPDAYCQIGGVLFHGKVEQQLESQHGPIRAALAEHHEPARRRSR